METINKIVKLVNANQADAFSAAAINASCKFPAVSASCKFPTINASCISPATKA